ncbi:10505_t:CDS:2 [Acaulospora morrowiae]|uniref:10505_t:CDS:1 n=1 Tax=Acaulospora morrowiae TaxID=94023 RepID=A0A9N9CM61_9GLOM|nr:10505_t:CDS:2 [Acaulospora morrowiae]
MSAERRPLIETDFEVRKSLFIPGIVTCGPNMNVQPKCFLGLLGTKGVECDSHWWIQRPIDQFKFVFPDTVGEAWLSNAKNCYILSPPPSARFLPNLVEEMTIHLYSNETTTSVSPIRRWAQFGIYWPWMGQDPFLVRPDFFNLPSESLFTFSRRELYKLDGRLQITYDMAPARRAIPLFRNESRKWGEIHIRPDYEPSLGGYEVTVHRERKYFTAYDLLPAIGGFSTLLIIIYKFLWGDSRLNPFGLLQKYIFRSAPSMSFNQLGREYGSYNNAIVLNRIEKPPSVALKPGGFTKMREDESDVTTSSKRDSDYPFKGYGPDDMGNSLLEFASSPGVGGNGATNDTNPFHGRQNQRDVIPMEVEGLRREVNQLRNELKNLENLLKCYCL